LHIIYHDVGGTHSTVAAAAIHLHMLPMNRTPSASEILDLSLFDKLEKKDQGRLIFHGKDEYNHSIYTISRQYYGPLVTNAIKTVCPMINQNEKEILCINTSPAVNTLMRIGGGSSRRFGLVAFGRPIVTYGTIQAYPKIAEIVKKVKLKIAP
jgi:uncharacterized protein DUF3189